MSEPAPVLEAIGTAARKVRGLRWYIVAILFFATTINYMDRITVAALKDVLQREVGFDEAGYGWINFSFQLAYAIMFAVSGRLLDRFGVRVTMTWAVVVWSLAAMGHTLASTTFGFAAARFLLGLGEAANFPACVKSVSQWFPQRERALATGIFNTGTNVGAMMIGPIAALAVLWGWRPVFIIIGSLGFVWLIAWLKFYRAPSEHPNLRADERAFIEGDQKGPVKSTPVPWQCLLRYRQAWAVAFGKLVTDPVWWFYLIWLPPYLKGRHTGSTAAFALLVSWPYISADIGSILGGWLSSHLIKRGWNVARSRLLTMFIFAFGLPFSMMAVFTDNMTVALVCISLATACHQAWSANLFTLASDMFPQRAVGSVVGFASMSGAIGGLIMTLVAGGMLQWLGSYTPLFVIAGVMHPVGWIAIRLLAGGRMPPADLDAGLRTQRSPGLLLGGAILGVAGLIGATTIALNWTQILAAVKGSVSAAAAGLGASTLIALIGLGLAWASREQKLDPASR
jgi:ACS family hexuronate transporter-like MFS transporter